MAHKGFSRYYAHKVSAPAPVICEDCGKVFMAGPFAHFCPECRRKRLSVAAKKRNLSKLGNMAYSKQQAVKKQ